jgi:Ca2+-transporting ATPase
VMGNLALIFSNRSRHGSLLASLRVPNRTLWIVCGVTLGFLALALYLPWLARLFFFAPLSAPDLLLAVALGLVSVVWFEAIKLSRRLKSANR